MTLHQQNPPVLTVFPLCDSVWCRSRCVSISVYRHRQSRSKDREHRRSRERHHRSSHGDWFSLFSLGFIVLIIFEAARILRRTGSMQQLGVHLSVCPVSQQQQRHVAGLLLNAGACSTCSAANVSKSRRMRLHTDLLSFSFFMTSWLSVF